jgi:hypothetical protein
MSASRASVSAGSTTTGAPVLWALKTMSRSSRTTFSIRSTRLASRASSGSSIGVWASAELNGGAAIRVIAAAAPSRRRRRPVIIASGRR